MSGSLMTADDIDYNTKSTLLMLISKMSTTRHTASAKKIQEEKQRNTQQQQQNSGKPQQIYQPKSGQQLTYPHTNIKQEPSDHHHQISYPHSLPQDRQNDYHVRQANEQTNFKQISSFSTQRCNVKQHAQQQQNYKTPKPQNPKTPLFCKIIEYLTKPIHLLNLFRILVIDGTFVVFLLILPGMLYILLC